MPASPPVGVAISGLAAQPEGWYVQYPDGSAYEVACWGLLYDQTGAVPLIFDKASGKLVPPGSGAILVHSHWPEQSTVLAGQATEPGSGPEVNLGGLFSRKSLLVTSSPGSVFAVQMECAIELGIWYPVGADVTKDGIFNEVATTAHYVRVRIKRISGGNVTVKLAWS